MKCPIEKAKRVLERHEEEWHRRHPDVDDNIEDETVEIRAGLLRYLVRLLTQKECIYLMDPGLREESQDYWPEGFWAVVDEREGGIVAYGKDEETANRIARTL